jgi:PPOX class probable F420-dependent enzyme
MQIITPEFQDLLSPEKKAFGYLATTMKNGTPQITVVWFSWNGTHILVNTAEGRVKDRNMREHPAVAILIGDPADAYRYIQVRGKVVEIIEVGADEHINSLSLKYTGSPWVKVEGQTRVIYKILPEHITQYA